eukprot:g19568.t1
MPWFRQEHSAENQVVSHVFECDVACVAEVLLPERKPGMISLSLTSRFAWRKLGKVHIGAALLQRFMKVSSE